MQKMLITGSGGFLGSRIAAFYREVYEVVALTRAKLDITVEHDVRTLIRECAPDIVIHCAAISDTGYAQEHPEQSYHINVAGTKNIALACEETGAKLIYMSSDQIYNGCTKAGALAEEDAMPKNVYGKHKLEAEKEASAIAPSSVGLRLTWMYDLPNRNKKTNSNLLWNLIKAIREDKPLSFKSWEYRGITYVWELIENMDKIIELPGGIYNCGSENDESTYDTAWHLMDKLVGKRAGHFIVKESEPTDPSEPNPFRNLSISNKRMKDQGIHFSNTQEGFLKCMKEYGIWELPF